MKMVTDRCLIPVYIETIESSLKRDPAVKAVLTLGYTEKDAIETATLLKEETVPLSSDVLLERLSKEMKCPVNPHCIKTKSLVTKKDLDLDLQDAAKTSRNIYLINSSTTRAYMRKYTKR
ncbi:uncharacterized protein LOC106052412 isoform X1 [Biomphalaria glabrata]|uniref:Uncharacterized protein LOC106052412 isoform X1 n=1 Tax=Biomphalaria glabrata TaxID=6526 RepID=A0A9W3A6L2_BIOGL|nr:uncharacterized protein LOC106052412 isoform X1 [Biomphalaria glabrata]